MTDARTIAERLTKSQAVVLRAHNTAPGWHSSPKAGCWRRQGAVSQYLARAYGLFESRYEKANGLRWYKFTELGREVRAILDACSSDSATL